MDDIEEKYEVAEVAINELAKTTPFPKKRLKLLGDYLKIVIQEDKIKHKWNRLIIDQLGVNLN